MLDGSVSYGGALQKGAMERYYCQVVGGSVLAMLEGLYRNVCNRPAESLFKCNSDYIFCLFKAVFCGMESESSLLFWSESIQSDSKYTEYTDNGYHLDRPYGVRDYKGCGIEGFSCRLIDVYAIWTSAIKDYGKERYEQAMESSGFDDIPGMFGWAAKELGIAPMLDALYSGVPIGDIIA